MKKVSSLLNLKHVKIYNHFEAHERERERERRFDVVNMITV